LQHINDRSLTIYAIIKLKSFEKEEELDNFQCLLKDFLIDLIDGVLNHKRLESVPYHHLYSLNITEKSENLQVKQGITIKTQK